MSLPEIVSDLTARAAARLRREVLCLVVAAACAVGAIYQGATAAVIGLAPYTGPALAHLSVAAAFIAVGAAALVIPRLSARRRTARSAAQSETALPRSLQMAAIIEALLFGFALAGKAKEDPK